MNILLVTPFYAPQLGGVATYLADLKPSLSELGHSVYVLRHGPSDRDEIVPDEQSGEPGVFQFYMREPVPDSTPVKGLIAFFAFLLPTLWRLSKFLKAREIGLVCVNYPLPPHVYFWILRMFGGFRLLVDVHGDDVLSLDAHPSWWRAMAPWLVRRADMVLAHSRDMLESSRVKLGGLPESTVLNYWLNPLPEALDDGAKRDPYILVPAHLYRRKGIDVLIGAAARLPDLPYRIVVSGEGPERERLAQQASALGVAERFEFLGAVDRPRMAALFRGCEFLVLPSRQEPFGIVLLEGMAFGKAIVASRVGGIPEFVTPDVGRLVPVEDSEALAAAIHELAADVPLRNAMGEAGRRLVELQYSRAALMRRYEKLFLDVV